MNLSNPKKYFNDRFVLFMLTVNAFLAIICIVSVLLRLGDTSNAYILAYRSNLGLNAYSRGNAGQILSFALFAGIVFVGQLFISLQMHTIRKHASWVIMVMAMLLLVLALIISNALLQLR